MYDAADAGVGSCTVRVCVRVRICALYPSGRERVKGEGQEKRAERESVCVRACEA